MPRKPTTTTAAPSAINAALAVKAMSPAERGAYFRALYGMTEAERRRRCPWKPRGYYSRGGARACRSGWRRRPWLGARRER